MVHTTPYESPKLNLSTLPLRQYKWIYLQMAGPPQQGQDPNPHKPLTTPCLQSSLTLTPRTHNDSLYRPGQNHVDVDVNLTMNKLTRQVFKVDVWRLLFHV